MLYSLPVRSLLVGTFLVAASGCGMIAQNRNAAGIRYYNLGAVAHLQGFQTRNNAQIGQAESLYRQCLSINPNHVDCHRGLAVLLAQTQRIDQAFEVTKNWCVTSPQSADARVELARLYEEYGDLRTAELQLQQALQIDLNNPRVHASLGSVKEKMGDLPQALANYQRSYTLNTFQPGVPERIASLQQRVGSAPATNLAPVGTGSLRSAGAAGFTNRNY